MDAVHDGTEPEKKEQNAPAARRKGSSRRVLARWIKRALLLLVVAGVGGGLVYGWLPKPLPVEVAEASRGPMRATVDEDGVTQVRQRHLVRAPITGELARIELRAGDELEEGGVIAKLFPAISPLLDPRSRATAEARLAAASASERQSQARVAHAQAALDFAKGDVRRFEELLRAGAAPKREVEQARLAAQTAEAELRAAELGARVALADMAAARASLGSGKGDDREPVEVRAPVEGRVLRVLEKSEGLVAAGTPLIEVGDLASIEIAVDVLTRDAVSIEPGAKAIVEGWGGKPLDGKIERIEPSAFTRLSALGVEEQRVNVIVSVASPPPKLGDGFRVEVKIVVWESEDALRVPASSLFRDGDGWALFELRDGQAKKRAVEVGRRSGSVAQIVSGLDAGAQVIVHPSDRIADGVEAAPE
jgi:HlyD family secretion protein